MQVQMQTSPNEEHDKHPKNSDTENVQKQLQTFHIPVTHSTSFQPLKVALSRKLLAFCKLQDRSRFTLVPRAPLQSKFNEPREMRLTSLLFFETCYTVALASQSDIVI